MKKTLAAVAVLGAFAGSSLAADVTLYGLVDEGFAYNHVDYDGVAADKDSFALNSGMQSTSRFGFKGTEDLGNGVTVGFILENGFNADTGADSSNFFDRESSLFLQGNFGRLAVGRMGTMNAGPSSWAKIGRINPFGTSNWGGYAANLTNTFVTDTTRNNMISYETPKFAGFQAFAQYSMGGDGSENESGSDRYYGIGATYDNGPVSLYAAVDSINYQSYTAATKTAAAHTDDVDDSLTVTLGGSYDFEVAKVYLAAQYFDEVNVFGGTSSVIFKNAYKIDLTNADFKVKGYGVTLAATFPVAGGKLMAGVGYTDAEAADSEKDVYKDLELTRYAVSVGYDYPLSKRTDVYGVASYMKEKYESGVSGDDDVKPSAFALSIALRHKF